MDGNKAHAFPSFAVAQIVPCARLLNRASGCNRPGVHSIALGTCALLPTPCRACLARAQLQVAVAHLPPDKVAEQRVGGPACSVTVRHKSVGTKSAAVVVLQG